VKSAAPLPREEPTSTPAEKPQAVAKIKEKKLIDVVKEPIAEAVPAAVVATAVLPPPAAAPAEAAKKNKMVSRPVVILVAVLRIRDVYPGSKNSSKERGEKNFLSYLFL
jgi:hypothetical protein